MPEWRILNHTLTLGCDCSACFSNQSNLPSEFLQFLAIEAPSLSWSPGWTFCSSNACFSQNNRSLSILSSLISVDRKETQNYEINTINRGTKLLRWHGTFDVLEWNATWDCLSVLALSLKVFGCVLIRRVVAIQVVLQVPRIGNKLCRRQTVERREIDCWKIERGSIFNCQVSDFVWLLISQSNDSSVVWLSGLRHSIGLARCALCTDKLITTKQVSLFYQGAEPIHQCMASWYRLSTVLFFTTSKQTRISPEILSFSYSQVLG